VLALDVGGANTKAAWVGDGPLRTASRPFEVWRDREALAGVLREVAAAVGGEVPAAVGLTMTAELSDAFRSKREGVHFVLDAVEAAFAGRPLHALTTAGALLAPAEARARPLELAAANWVASALAVAEACGDAMMIDVGSTTADVIPIADGRVTAQGRTDLDRLLAGELVYTGVLRTTLAAIAPEVPVRGALCPVAAEQFAIAADVHLILGHLGPGAYTCPTHDGRPATVEHARERVARLVCADLEQLGRDEVDAIARFLAGAQARRIEAAAERAARRVRASAPVVALGAGAFLAREAAGRLGREVADGPPDWREGGAEPGPAAALAQLLAARLGAPC
jgi:probable H4MPT-linked C1 transfer pathway protein